MKTDIRWIQRFSNFNKALSQLTIAVQSAKERKLNDLEEEGLIQRFEYTHELAWNVMKDYLLYQGINNITGSRDAIRKAFQEGILVDGKAWMKTIESRNKTSHTYNEKTAKEIIADVVNVYTPLFTEFKLKMEQFEAIVKNDELK